jgi:hypothetical protein
MQVRTKPFFIDFLHPLQTATAIKLLTAARAAVNANSKEYHAQTLTFLYGQWCSLPELEELIRTAGFFRNEAKSIQGAAKKALDCGPRIRLLSTGKAAPGCTRGGAGDFRPLNPIATDAGTLGPGLSP